LARGLSGCRGCRPSSFLAASTGGASRPPLEISNMTIATPVSAGCKALLALALATMALPAFAQEAAPAAPEVAETLLAANTQTRFILNSFLMLFGGVLVFWMAAGFTMLE